MHEGRFVEELPVAMIIWFEPSTPHCILVKVANFNDFFSFVMFDVDFYHFSSVSGVLWCCDIAC